MAAQGAEAAAACPLLRLSDDVLEVVGHQIADALRPAVACALAACNNNLWRVMRAPLAKLQPRHAAARALVAKVSRDWRSGAALELRWSCAAVSDAMELDWHGRLLDADDMATLAMLFSTGALARVERLWLGGNPLGSAATPWSGLGYGDVGGPALLSGLDCGHAPRLKLLNLANTGLGNEGAAALAGALSRGAMPKLEDLNVGRNGLSDEGLAALAAPLRRRPAIKSLRLNNNRICDAGLSALVDNLGAKELKRLDLLDLSSNQIGDAGCAALIIALDVTTLPLMRAIWLGGDAATPAAQQAVHDALQANRARASTRS